MGRRVPYGFIKVKTKVEGINTSTFENDPAQIPVLVKMYELYSNTDMSLGKVSDYLNNKKIPAPQGGLWDSCKISRVLRSPLYVKADADIYLYFKNKGCNISISNEISEFIGINGCFLYGKRESNERKYTKVIDHVLSIGLHEGIVDSHTWLLCQYKLDDNKQIKNSGKGKHSWLSGYIKCGYCNYAVSVIASGDYKYFNCRGKTNYKTCKGHSKPIYVDKIESIIKNYIFEKSKELKETTLQVHNTENIEANKIKLQIIDIENQIENLVSQLAKTNNVVMKYVNDKITSLDITKNTLLEEMKKLKINSNQARPFENVL